MFNPEIHYIDPQGLLRTKKTNQIVGTEQAQPWTRHPQEGAAFPKWVTPHASHVKHNPGGHAFTALFDQTHTNRHDGSVTVLVKDAAQEKMALAPLAKS